jgi:AcrR family transcriptional regulator
MAKLTKRDILDAAAAVFIKEGFEGTTFAEIAKGAGGVVGSVQHAFPRKAQLAAAVYDDVVGGLIAGCEAALGGQGRDPQTAIRALLRACLVWAKKERRRRHLLVLLEANVSIRTMTASGGLQKQMEQVLRAWADPLIKVDLVIPMSPAQMFSVLLAPALSIIGSEEFDDAYKPAEWLNRLAEFAFNAVTTQRRKPEPPTATGSTRASSKSTGQQPKLL